MEHFYYIVRIYLCIFTCIKKVEEKNLVVWLKFIYLFILFIKNSRSELISPSINQQQFSGYPAMRSTDEIDKTVVKEAESALRAMREHSEENEDDNVFTRLVIEEPEEFRGIYDRNKV